MRDENHYHNITIIQNDRNFRNKTVLYTTNANVYTDLLRRSPADRATVRCHCLHGQWRLEHVRIWPGHFPRFEVSVSWLPTEVVLQLWVAQIIVDVIFQDHVDDRLLVKLETTVTCVLWGSSIAILWRHVCWVCWKTDDDDQPTKSNCEKTILTRLENCFSQCEMTLHVHTQGKFLTLQNYATIH